MAVKGPVKKKGKKKAHSSGQADRSPAVSPRSTFPASMDPDVARMAGMGSLALGVIAAVLLIVYAGIHYDMPTAQMGAFAACVLVCVGACALGVLLLKGAAAAHYVLLWFWLALTGSATVFGLAAALWQAPTWWDKAIPLAAVVGPVVGLGAVISVLMVLVSKSGTRLRYGTMVTVSLVAAVTVVATVNVIAHRDPIHKDFQALGVYGVSERTEKVLQGVDQPLRLTCVYTSTEKDKLGADFRPRVTELLEEIRAKMRGLDKPVEVTTVTTDRQKAEVIDRLQQKLREQAGGQVKFLQEFQGASDDLVAMLATEQQDWVKLPKDSYLSQWELPQRVRGMLRSKTEKIQELGKKVQDQLGSARVVDYTSLVSDVKKGLEELQQDLKDAVPVMKRRGEIHKEAKKNRKSALASLAKFDKAVAAVEATLSEDSAKKDPKAALSNFATSAATAADQAKDVARALEDFAGSGNADYLAAAGCWQVSLRTAMGVARAPVSELYAISGEQLAELATNAQGMVQVLTPDAQAKQIAFMRQRLARVKALADAGGKAARQGADILAKVDPATQAVLDRAEKDDLFQEILPKLKGLLQRIEGLPKVESKALPDDLAEDNIVIVEVGDNFEVASFEEVWPLRDRNRGRRAPSDEDEEKRIFNGDSAVASKILSVTRKQKPFATVYLTYLAPFDRDTSMQMMRMAMQMRMGMGPPPNAAMNPGMLSTLRQRLTEANFELREWDLAQPLEIPQDATRPQVLVVLPPSSVSMRNPMTAMMMQRFQGQMRQFGQVHADRLKAAVDAGVPAVFLTGSAWSAYQPRFTQIVDYLKKDWGVEVKRDYRVLAGVPDPDQPGMYKVDILSINYLPLSTFSDHPIGKPLQGQRMLWTEVAPLDVAENDAGKRELPQGVTHQSLLSVTEDRTDVWAPKEINRLFDAIRAQQTGLIRAGAGDITAPFDLAVVAERKAAPADRPDATALAVTDVKDWKALRDAVVSASKAPAFPPRPGMPTPAPKPAKRVWELLDKNVQTRLQSADTTKLTLAMKKDVIDSLNRMLKNPTFYKRSGKRPPMPTRPGMPPMPTPKEPFDAVALPREAVELYHRQQKAEKGPAPDGKDDDEPAKPLSETEQMRLNRLVMEAAMPKVFAESRAVRPARIVVLGMGPSFFDGYMDQGVPRLTGKGGFSFDPAPRADADLIVSSVYWLSGNKEYIAAGPAVVKPVNVSRWARVALGALCVIGLPLVVLAAGGGVMIMRRRG